MKFNLSTPAGGNIITSYDAETIVVDGKSLTRSFVLAPDTLIDAWRPQRFSDLTSEDLEQVMALEPEIALLGTGRVQRFPAAQMLTGFYSRGISLEAMTTAAACRTYNIIRAEDRRVVAAILLD